MATKSNKKKHESILNDDIGMESPQESMTFDNNQIVVSDLIEHIFAATAVESTDDQKDKAKHSISRYISQAIEESEISSSYNIVFIYDNFSMIDSDADKIYSAVTRFEEKRPILVILHSSGGYISPAYLIGKLLHEYSSGKLNIVVPRRAKSAATLLCCAADRIHMGSLSELGPIDPQFEGLPALGLKSSIEHIAALVEEYPQATELFSRYMSATIKPIHLGHYERVAESATQYAERLMRPHKDSLRSSPEYIAKQLVYSYKDHAFAIDKQEAQNIFGDEVLLHNTPEYDFGNFLYQRLNFVKTVFDIRDFDFYLVGSTTTGPDFIRRRNRI